MPCARVENPLRRRGEAAPSQPGTRRRRALQDQAAWGFRESQLLDIESARLVFFTGGHGNLDVIDGEYFHS